MKKADNNWVVLGEDEYVRPEDKITFKYGEKATPIIDRGGRKKKGYCIFFY